MKSKKKISIILSFVLLSLSLVAIGVYLYKNPNIREKMSFASSLSIDKGKITSSKSPSLPIEPLYKFVKFDPVEYGSIKESVELESGKGIVAGELGYNDPFPSIWNREGEQLKYLSKEKYDDGYLYDLNKNGDFTTTYILYNDGFYFSSYLHNVNTDEEIELKFPDDFLTSPSSTLVENPGLAETKEYLKTLPNGIGTRIFESLYEPTQVEIVPYSTNNHGDIAGWVSGYTEDGTYLSRAVVWFKSNNHGPMDISHTIITQLGDSQSKEASIYSIDDNRNIWANAKIKGISTVGYFEYAGENRWKLKQTWNVDNQVVYLDVAARNDKYLVIRENNRSGDKIVYRKANPLGRFVTRKPYTYTLSVRGILEDYLGRNPRFVAVNSINNNNKLLGSYIDDNDGDSFIIDLETKSITMFSDLLDTGLVEYPEEIANLFPTAIDDEGNIYVSYYIPISDDPYNQEVGVAMLKKQ